MRRHVHPRNHAAESFVSFIPLFDGVAHSTQPAVPACRVRSGQPSLSDTTPTVPHPDERSAGARPAAPPGKEDSHAWSLDEDRTPSPRLPPSHRLALVRQLRKDQNEAWPVQPLGKDAARGARSRTYPGCGLAAEAGVRSVRTHSRVRRTPGISCEAVPASDPAGAGIRRHLRPSAACGARVGAAESFVSFIPLFDGPRVPCDTTPVVVLSTRIT